MLVVSKAVMMDVVMVEMLVVVLVAVMAVTLVVLMVVHWVDWKELWKVASLVVLMDESLDD